MATEATTPARSVGPVTLATSGSVALVAVLAWLARTIWGIDVPADVAGAAAVLVALVAGYLVPPRRAPAGDA